MTRDSSVRTAAVTGGAGFLARHLIDELLLRGRSVRALGRRPRPRELPPSVDYRQVDLRDRAAAEAALRGCSDVFHLAAVGWGFRENLTRQPELLTENLLLNTTVLDAAHRAAVERYLFASSSAVYPGHLEELDEDAAWEGPPHATEACFGWAKRMGELQAETYHRHHGMPVAIVRPANPYGPWDDFDPARSHVIPALIRRICSGERPLVVHGSGRAVRSFVYAPDAARAMVAALDRADDARPVNIASPEAISIRELVAVIASQLGLEQADIVFDSDQPEGHPRKVPKVTRMLELVGTDGWTPLDRGIAQTLAWYREHVEVGV